MNAGSRILKPNLPHFIADPSSCASPVDHASQTIGSRGRNFNLQDPAEERRIKLCMNGLQVGRTADQLTWTPPLAIKKYRHDSSDMG